MKFVCDGCGYQYPPKGKPVPAVKPKAVYCPTCRTSQEARKILREVGD